MSEELERSEVSLPRDIELLFEPISAQDALNQTALFSLLLKDVIREAFIIRPKVKTTNIKPETQPVNLSLEIKDDTQDYTQELLLRGISYSHSRAISIESPGFPPATLRLASPEAVLPDGEIELRFKHGLYEVTAKSFKNSAKQRETQVAFRKIGVENIKQLKFTYKDGKLATTSFDHWSVLNRLVVAELRRLTSDLENLQRAVKGGMREEIQAHRERVIASSLPRAREALNNTNAQIDEYLYLKFISGDFNPRDAVFFLIEFSPPDDATKNLLKQAVVAQTQDIETSTGYVSAVFPAAESTAPGSPTRFMQPKLITEKNAKGFEDQWLAACHIFLKEERGDLITLSYVLGQTVDSYVPVLRRILSGNKLLKKD